MAMNRRSLFTAALAAPAAAIVPAAASVPPRDYPVTVDELRRAIEADWPTVLHSTKAIERVVDDGGTLAIDQDDVVARAYDNWCWIANVIITERGMGDASREAPYLPLFTEEAAVRMMWANYHRHFGPALDAETNTTRAALIWRAIPEIRAARGIVRGYMRLSTVVRSPDGQLFSRMNVLS